MKPFNRKSTSNNRSSLALLLSLLHDLLDNLLFLNQERANHTVLDAVGTPGTTVGALDSLLWSGDAGVFARTQSRDLSKYMSTIALLDDREMAWRNCRLSMPKFALNQMNLHRGV
jgi:hypothetical protein